MKKQRQLGMNPSTASARLLKDLLFSLVVETGRDVCHRCGERLDRIKFSIDHKTAWLDSHDPIGLFFDLNNIAYSHLSCNVGASFKRHKIYASVKEQCAAAWLRRKPTYVRTKKRVTI